MLASTASDRKGAKNSSWYFMILPKNNCFQNIKIKLNSATWMTLTSSLVIFQALEPLQPQWPLQPQQPPWPQWPIQPHFIKKMTDTDGWIIPGTTMIQYWSLIVEWISENPIFHWYLVPFLSEAAEASPCYFFQNWLMKLKCPNLLKPLAAIV